MAKSRKTLMTVDLLGFKDAWVAWCSKNEVKPGEALRQVIARLIQGEEAEQIGSPSYRVNFGEKETPSRYRQVLLTESELMLLEREAAKEGFTASKWIVAAVRARLTRLPQFGHYELAALSESNANLRAIGRNLNQVAKAMRLRQEREAAPVLLALDELQGQIQSHTEMVGQVMQANLERWKVT